MGWLYMKSLKGHGGPTQYLDNQFTCECRSRVLRSALVNGRVYYAAVEHVRKDGGTREVFAVVCLVDFNPGDLEGYIFGYKDMVETMGPYESACPQPILDLLTPTDNAYANEWRARCRAAIAERAAAPKATSKSRTKGGASCRNIT
jgi:hypothetical protein